MANGTQDLGGTIQTGAGNPVQAAQDGLSATQQPLPDVIQADRYLASKQAVTPPFGLVLCGIVAGSSQGRSVGPPWSFGPPYC